MSKPDRDIRNYPDWLHAELMNWSRWCWLGPWPHPLPPDHCGSIESNYQRINEEYAEQESRPAPPNDQNARIVDSVWQALPGHQKLVLRAEYPQRYDSGRLEFGRIGAARRLKLGLRQYEEALFSAIAKVWTAFERKP